MDKRGPMARNEGGLLNLEVMDSGPEFQKGVRAHCIPLVQVNPVKPM